MLICGDWSLCAGDGEQIVLMVLEVAHSGYGLQTGVVMLSDDAQVRMKNDRVRKVYLGEN